MTVSVVPEIRIGEPIKLLDRDGLPEQYHVFDEKGVMAIRAALGAGRPLLVRGEPGVGKTQLAAAAAKELKRPLLTRVVDSRTESRDLMWEFDAVMRLADAQLAAAFHATVTAGLTNAPDKAKGKENSELPLELAGRAADGASAFEQLRTFLNEANYVRPGPLWWAFNWENARLQARRSSSPVPTFADDADPKNGCVVLIDEIDKAESDLPNGLLEALGAVEFKPMGDIERVRVSGPPPLVIITTNEERSLPNAFLRRCLVLHLELPRDDAELVKLLVERAKAHFSGADAKDTIFHSAAKLLVRDRKAYSDGNLLPLPGQAEFLDLVRALRRLFPNDVEAQENRLEEVARFVVRKHGEAIR